MISATLVSLHCVFLLFSVSDVTISLRSLLILMLVKSLTSWRAWSMTINIQDPSTVSQSSLARLVGPLTVGRSPVIDSLAARLWLEFYTNVCVLSTSSFHVLHFSIWMSLGVALELSENSCCHRQGLSSVYVDCHQVVSKNTIITIIIIIIIITFNLCQSVSQPASQPVSK